MKQLRILASMLACASLAISCSPSDADRAPLGTSSSPIVGGAPSSSDEDQVVFVASPIDADHSIACTGALVAPNIVLLARHCVSKTTPGTFSCLPEGKSGSGGDFGDDYDAAGIEVFVGPNYPSVGSDAPAAVGKKILYKAGTICDSDLALLVLATDIPGAKLAPIRLTTPVVENEAVVAVGFGYTGADNVLPSQRQRRETTIARLGPFPGTPTAPPLPPGYFSIAGAFLCQGDSGGPVISKATGEILGVASSGSPECGTNLSTSYASTYALSDLIQSELDKGQAQGRTTGTDGGTSAAADRGKARDDKGGARDGSGAGPGDTENSAACTVVSWRAARSRAHGGWWSWTAVVMTFGLALARRWRAWSPKV